jgi:hypothetical protein
MTSLTLYKWRVYCVDEGGYQYWWLDENHPAPDKCPNDSSHTIDPSLTKIVDVRDSEVFQIKQEATPTGQNYQWKTQSFTALAGQTTIYRFSYPINISVLEAQYVSSEENRGDSWTWKISPDTIIGNITNFVNPGDTVIPVTSTVTDNILEGFGFSLFDGVNMEDLGVITAIDKVNGTVTVSVPTARSWSPLTPTYAVMNIYFVQNGGFGHPWLMIFGEGKIIGSYVPANTVVQVEYTNNDPTLDKEITVYLEVMY